MTHKKGCGKQWFKFGLYMGYCGKEGVNIYCSKCSKKEKKLNEKKM